MTAATVAEQRFANQLEMLIPRLTRYARALTRDTDRANDLVQDVAVRAIEKQHLWPPETDLRAWLFTMMHNDFVNETRRNSRAERYAREWKLGYVEATKDRQIARLELRDMERALGELSEEKRQAVLLIGAEGMRYEDAAAVLDVPVGTVRSRISRGRDELRQLTTGETNDERAAKLPAPLPVPPPKDDRREPREVAEKRAEVIAALKATANRDAVLASIVPVSYPVTVAHRDRGEGSQTRAHRRPRFRSAASAPRSGVMKMLAQIGLVSKTYITGRAANRNFPNGCGNCGRCIRSYADYMFYRNGYVAGIIPGAALGETNSVTRRVLSRAKRAISADEREGARRPDSTFCVLPSGGNFGISRIGPVLESPAKSLRNARGCREKETPTGGGYSRKRAGTSGLNTFSMPTLLDGCASQYRGRGMPRGVSLSRSR